MSKESELIMQAHANSWNEGFEEGMKKGYEKAVYEFVEVMKANKENYSKDEYFSYMVDEIIDISVKQLKEGVSNERNSSKGYIQ